MKFLQLSFIKIFLIILLISPIALMAQSGEDDFYNLNYASDVTNSGTSAAAFLEIGIGARAEALGGAFTALANDASALYWNPAGLSQLQNISFTANHTRWLANTNFQYFGVVLPFGNNMVFGIGVTILDYIDNQPVRTINQPEGTGEFYDASDLAIGASYGMALTENFSFGLTAKYIRQSIWHETAESFAFDFGVLYITPLNGLNIGTSISNFGGEMQLDGSDLVRPYDADPQNYSNDKLNVLLKTDAFALPLLFRFGLSYSFTPFENHNFIIASDVIHPSNDVESLNAGIEYNFSDFLSLRGGYQSLFDVNRENGLTLGFGVKNPFENTLNISFDYAYSKWGVLGDVQRFSVDLIF